MSGNFYLLDDTLPSLEKNGEREARAPVNGTPVPLYALYLEILLAFPCRNGV